MTSTFEQDALDIEPGQVKQLLDHGADVFLLDCRTCWEHDQARIAGCTLIPLDQLGRRIDEIRAHENRLLVVVCHHGRRSMRVTMVLRQLGFAYAKSMTGGINQWSAEIDPRVPQYTK